MLTQRTVSFKCHPIHEFFKKRQFSGEDPGLSESFDVDGLVVKVSSQFWRNWRVPKAQASWGLWGHAPPRKFLYLDALFSAFSRLFSLQNY